MEDLAYIHDAGFLGFSRRAAPHVLRRLERRCEPGATVVEIGCGSGGLTKALTKAGYATTTTKVRGPIQGIQICQHHCPVSHVAEEFPELCEAEQQAMSEILGTHVQRLATIANGDCACTTHVPMKPVQP